MNALVSYDPSQPSSDPADYVFVLAWIKLNSRLTPREAHDRALSTQRYCAKFRLPVDTVYTDGKKAIRVHDVPIGTRVFELAPLVPAWTTMDHRITPIARMETTHIRNCLAMIFLRSDGWRHWAVEHLINELKKREDHDEIRSGISEAEIG